MKLGKTVEKPTEQDVIEKYRGLWEKLKQMLPEPEMNKAKKWLIELEWGERFYELINQEHKGKLSYARQQSEYENFYENVLKKFLALKPYLVLEDAILNIPIKKKEVYKRLKSELYGYDGAINLIKEFYPFQRRKPNKRESEIDHAEKFIKVLNEPKRYIAAGRWHHVKAVKDKVAIFKGVETGVVYPLKDEDQDVSYTNITQIEVRCLHDGTLLQNDEDYTLSPFGDLQFLSLKCEDIKVIFSTNPAKFKQNTV